MMKNQFPSYRKPLTGSLGEPIAVIGVLGEPVAVIGVLGEPVAVIGVLGEPVAVIGVLGEPVAVILSLRGEPVADRARGRQHNVVSGFLYQWNWHFIII